MAVTIDVGVCPACDTKNSTSADYCRNCREGLPWSKKARKVAAGTGAQATPAVAAAPAAALPSPAPKASGLGLKVSDVAWLAMGVQIFGGIVFLAGVFFWFGNVLGFYPTFRGLGYIVGVVGLILWRAGAEMD